MKHKKMMNKGMKKICAIGAALAIAITSGVTAFAEDAADAQLDAATAAQTDVAGQAAGVLNRGGRQGMGVGMGMRMRVGEMNQSNLTDEQQQAMKDAQSTYYAAEDAVLAEMVTAGALSQEIVDSYQAQRNAQQEVAAMDYSDWTLDQLSALRQAIGRSGVNETVLAGLVSQGALTEAQAETFKLAYGESVNVWGQLDTSKATQGMMTRLQEARAAYQQALADAGILGTRNNMRKSN